MGNCIVLLRKQKASLVELIHNMAPLSSAKCRDARRFIVGDLCMLLYMFVWMGLYICSCYKPTPLSGSIIRSKRQTIWDMIWGFLKLLSYFCRGIAMCEEVLLPSWLGKAGIGLDIPLCLVTYTLTCNPYSYHSVHRTWSEWLCSSSFWCNAGQKYSLM